MIDVRTSIGDDLMVGAPLDFRTRFPAYTIGEDADFDEYINELAGDFANAGGFLAAKLPRYTLTIHGSQ